MSDRALEGSVMTVRKGQTMLAVQCLACGAGFKNPTTAARHALKRGKGHYAKVDPTRKKPANPVLAPGFDPIKGGTLPVPDDLVCSALCMDRGEFWLATPCLCMCHYQGLTARRMIKETDRESAD